MRNEPCSIVLSRTRLESDRQTLLPCKKDPTIWTSPGKGKMMGDHVQAICKLFMVLPSGCVAEKAFISVFANI